MKIDLKLSNDQIMATSKLLEHLEDRKAFVNSSEKLAYSIAIEVYGVFQNKKKNLIKKANLFDAKTKTKITLKYYEAFGLSAFIDTLIHTVNNDYFRTILQKMNDEIKQKLA